MEKGSAEMVARTLAERQSADVTPQGEESEQEWVIGSRNEYTTTLPLTPALEFLATDAQRARIGRIVLKRILSEDPNNRNRNSAELRSMIMERSGLSDAAASLALYAMEDELQDA